MTCHKLSGDTGSVLSISGGDEQEYRTLIKDVTRRPQKGNCLRLTHVKRSGGDERLLQI